MQVKNKAEGDQLVMAWTQNKEELRVCWKENEKINGGEK